MDKNLGFWHSDRVSFRYEWSWELKLVVCILGKYIQNKKIKFIFFETYFWSKILSRTKMFGFFLDLLEDSHCKLQWKSRRKSKKNLKFLARDKNFDQKYVSKKSFLFFYFVYIFQVCTQQVTAPSEQPNYRCEKICLFIPLIDRYRPSEAPTSWFLCAAALCSQRPCINDPDRELKKNTGKP